MSRSDYDNHNPDAEIEEKSKASYTRHISTPVGSLLTDSTDGAPLPTDGRNDTELPWDEPPPIHERVNITPREIHGNWQAGYALDVHTLSSYRSGDRGYERTELGELVYQVKYCDDMTKLQPLAEIAAPFVKEDFAFDGHAVHPYLDAIVPIPCSSNKYFQPVTEIATRIGRILDVPVPSDYLVKVKAAALQNFESEESRSEHLQGAFAIRHQQRKYRCVLLFDDIYGSGETLAEATTVLQRQGGISYVFVLTLTQTRTQR